MGAIFYVAIPRNRGLQPQSQKIAHLGILRGSGAQRPGLRLRPTRVLHTTVPSSKQFGSGTTQAHGAKSVSRPRGVGPKYDERFSNSKRISNSNFKGHKLSTWIAEPQALKTTTIRFYLILLTLKPSSAAFTLAMSARATSTGVGRIFRWANRAMHLVARRLWKTTLRAQRRLSAASALQAAWRDPEDRDPGAEARSRPERAASRSP